MRKKEIIEYLESRLDDNDYTYLVLDMRDWEENKPDIFVAWKQEE